MLQNDIHVSFVLPQITRLTDRRTDGRTDSSIVARPRCVQCMQRGKNYEIVLVCTCTVTIVSHRKQ